MTVPDDELRSAMVTKLSLLLRKYEASWSDVALWIETRALEEGFDLNVDFESPERFSHSLIEGMRFHAVLSRRFPNGVSDLDGFEVAEELFWHLMPRSESDYSAQADGEPQPAKRNLVAFIRKFSFAPFLRRVFGFPSH